MVIAAFLQICLEVLSHIFGKDSRVFPHPTQNDQEQRSIILNVLYFGADDMGVFILEVDEAVPCVLHTGNGNWSKALVRCDKYYSAFPPKAFEQFFLELCKVWLHPRVISTFYLNYNFKRNNS